MTNQTIPLCEVCGNRTGTDGHHLLRRGSHPDQVDDPKNIVRLCRDCHLRTESDPAFYEDLQQIFYYWRQGNVDLFLRAEATIEALANGQDIEYLTPAMTDNYLVMAGAKYGHLSEQMANLEKLWYQFFAKRTQELLEASEKPTATRLEAEWYITTNGRSMIDYKYKLKALEKLQSNLRARLDRFRTERFTKAP